GTNIIIEGSNMGAASDINGEYIINNIPPGKYTLIVSGVGFQKRRLLQVQVSADFTTNVDIEMSTEAIETETVVVQAKNPMILKDLTSSHTTVDASTIASLPVESITQLLTLQAGITQGAGGEIHIRGGRANETSYTVNGMSISNPYDNSKTVTIATNAVQELSVVSGTFNAEYGNALSGIVNTITKEGSNNLHGSATFYTGDYLSNNTETFFNIDDIDPLNNTVSEFTLAGPILSNKLSFFVSGRYANDKGYLYGIKQHNVTDSVVKNPLDPNDILVLSSGDGSIVPMNSGWSFSTTGKMTYRPISTFKINIDLHYSKNEYTPYDHDLKYNPDANNPRYGWGFF
ncbi:MAG: TonB-dependent receptor, partial [Melioribacteraceae bacterium]|nr:TonB-dependent receptor [Melioribacteraceae bacterium]